MKPTNLLLSLAATAGFMLFGANAALADDCGLLGGVIVNVPPNECQVSGGPHHIASQVAEYTLNEGLHILPGGTIIIDPPPVPPPPTLITGATIRITAGDFLMDGGALLDGSVAACATGASITVNLDDGDIALAPGSIIRSNSCSGGAIALHTSAAHTAEIDGTVESVGSRTGDGSGKPGGGTISIIAGCSLDVSDTGLVSSRGRDPGADLVHLEGCAVSIHGIVESTAPGHVNPDNPPNHCNLDPVAHPPGGAPSTFFTGCVEIWSGTTVLIHSTGTHKGEVNADIGITGGSQGRGWIDIYARGNINIVDGTGNDHQYVFGGGCVLNSTFAVHSNGGLCQNTDDGGLITIKSLDGDVVATGNAVQADATSGGSNGGEVHVEAFNNVDFTGATLTALGDNNGGGGFGIGGKLGTAGAPIRAFHGTLNWVTGVGDVRPTGTAVGAGNRGVIILQSCGAAALGATFPVTGLGAPTTPTTIAGCAGAGVHPTKATSGDLPAGDCLLACRLPSTKSGTKFFDTNNNYQRDALEPGLANWQINAYQGGVLVDHVFTDGSGNYKFNLAAGNYQICEVQQPGFTQTCPQGPFPNGLGCAPGPAPITNAFNCTPLTGGGVGYDITLTAGENEVGNDFGNFRATPLCPEDPNAKLSRSVSNANSGVPNYATLQEAYDAAGSGETIGMFGKTKENVTLGGDKSLKITQCTSAQITALNGSLPVWNITSTGKLTIVGPDSVGGTIGWLVANPSGGPHTLKSIRANGASQYGVQIDSNGNNVSWNDVSGNGPGAGIRVNGGSNVLKGGTVGPNTGDGVQLFGAGNTLSGATVQSNTINGVLVVGASNTIKSNKANSNGADGFKNANGAGNNYSGNSSNTGGKENGGAEYRFVTAGVNGGSNRADGINVPKTSTPTKCANFAAANSFCE